MYSVLDRFGTKHPCRWIDNSPYITGVNFRFAERISAELPDPLEFTLKPLNLNANDHGPEMPEYFEGSIPLFRDDLIESMTCGGVDNLDLYNVIIHDPDTGTDYTNYKAANIIGVVSAADMEKSNATIHPGGPIIDVDFDGLVVDESRTGGALIFRLAESTSTILIHEKLRDHLLAEGFTKLEFLNPEECAL